MSLHYIDLQASHGCILLQRWSVERTPLCWQRLFLDARVVDLTRLYRPIFGTISPWRPFCFNGPDNQGRCVGHVEAEDPGIQ